jgi:hypothetical protein
MPGVRGWQRSVLVSVPRPCCSFRQPPRADSCGTDSDVPIEAVCEQGLGPLKRSMRCPVRCLTLAHNACAAWRRHRLVYSGAAGLIAHAWARPPRAQDDGFVAKLLVEPGAKDIPVGTPLLVMVEDEADVGKFADFSPGGGGGGGEPAAAGQADEGEAGDAAPAEAPEAPASAGADSTAAQTVAQATGPSGTHATAPLLTAPGMPGPRRRGGRRQRRRRQRRRRV